MAPVFDGSVFDSTVFDTGGGVWAANIDMTATMVGSLQLTVDLVSNIAMTMTVVGGLTALVSLASNIPMVMNMLGPLRVARNAERLDNCGDPISTACQDTWMPGA